MSNQLQMYIDKKLNESDIKKILYFFKTVSGNLINIVDESDVINVTEAEKYKREGYASYSYEIIGNSCFMSSFIISWIHDQLIYFDTVSFLKLVNIHCNCQIITDLPANHPKVNDPIYWCLFDLYGDMCEVCVDDMKDVEFVLIKDSKKKLSQDIKWKWPPYLK